MRVRVLGGLLAAGSMVAVLATEGCSVIGERRLEASRSAAAPEVAPPIGGNATRLLVDGPATHGAMFAAIARARDHVHLQTYIIEADEAGRKLAELLIERRRSGVAVGLMYDAIGGIRAPAEYFDRLRAEGIAVCEANPVAPDGRGRVASPNHRDHRKILVVDGRVAFTGGVNISDVYASGSASARRRAEQGDGWRDTHVELRGPAVAGFQRLFVDAWARQGCEPLAARMPFPALAREGDRTVQVLASSPRHAAQPIRDAWLTAIGDARRSVYVTMAYFVPDPQTLETLEAAARRGVDVRLVLPGFSDFWVVHAAGRSHYARLLEAGVRIHERRDALLHAKTAVVDGTWSTIGSANLDWRSFLHNDEVAVVITGAAFGREMDALFAGDLERSVPVTRESWARRGVLDRGREALARLFEYWL